MPHAPNTAAAGSRDREFWFVGTETLAESTSEIKLTSVPARGRILVADVQIVSGSATSIVPLIGGHTDPASSPRKVYWEAQSASDRVAAGGSATKVREQPGAGMGAYYYAPSRELFLRLVPDQGGNNQAAWEVLILRDWMD